MIVGILVLVMLILILIIKKGKNKKESLDEDDYDDSEQDEEDDDEDEEESDSLDSEDEMAWDWDDNNALGAEDTAVSAQEVDPLTEYQVYKQFGYEDKAATSLAGYLNNLKTNAPEKLVHELLGLSLRISNIDLLTETLSRHAKVLSKDKLAEYVKAGLQADENHLNLRVLAESKLNWGMQEVARQIGESSTEAVVPERQSAQQGASASDVGDSDSKVSNESKRSPLIIGRAKVSDMTEEELSAVIGFVKPEISAKLLKDDNSQNKNYELVVQQYNRAIEKTDKPANLLIDVLRVDYQHSNVNQFAAHLWKLYHSLGQYGRQVKERMLGWGYNLGHHDVFDALEQSPSEQRVKEIGIQHGYIESANRQLKVQHKELVQRNDSVRSEKISPADLAMKEVESLLMYGQLDYAVSTLEDAILKYPQESQLYVLLFDLYERTEDWARLEQFRKEHENNLPEEVTLAMSQLLQRANSQVK